LAQRFAVRVRSPKRKTVLTEEGLMPGLKWLVGLPFRYCPMKTKSSITAGPVYSSLIAVICRLWAGWSCAADEY
jgi:hypothetical protein